MCNVVGISVTCLCIALPDVRGYVPNSLRVDCCIDECGRVRPIKYRQQDATYEGTALPNGCIKTNKRKDEDLDPRIQLDVPVPDILRDSNYKLKKECIKVDREKGIPAWQKKCYNKHFCLGSKYPFDKSEPQYDACFVDAENRQPCVRRKQSASPKPAELIQQANKTGQDLPRMANTGKANEIRAWKSCKEPSAYMAYKYPKQCTYEQGQKAERRC